MYPKTDISGGLCYQSEGGTLNCGSKSFHTSYSAEEKIYPTTIKAGFYVNIPDLPFNEYDKTLKFSFVSDTPGSEKVDYSVRIHRPAKAVSMPRADVFKDVMIEAGKTTDEYILADFTGVLNAPGSLKFNPTHVGGSLCSQAYDTLNCGKTSLHSFYTQSVSLNEATTAAGFRVYLPKDKSVAYDETIQFRFESTGPGSPTVNYSVRVRRPAL